MKSIERATGRFRREEEGGVLIEAVLWFPVMFALFVMAADASVMFMNQARIKSVMQEGGRRMAIGELQECAALTEWLEANIRQIAPTAWVDDCRKDPASATVSVVEVNAPSAELLLTGGTGLLAGITVNVRVLYHQEVG